MSLTKNESQTLVLETDGRVFQGGSCLGRVVPGPAESGWVASGVSGRLYPTPEHAALGLAQFAARVSGGG